MRPTKIELPKKSIFSKVKIFFQKMKHPEGLSDYLSGRPAVIQNLNESALRSMDTLNYKNERMKEAQEFKFNSSTEKLKIWKDEHETTR
jgi:hypothetical protein